MEQRNRNTAILLIAAGLFLFFGSLVGYFTVTAVLILWLAIMKIRANDNIGYVLLGVAVIMLLNDHFVAMVAVILVLAGLYYYSSRDVSAQDGFWKKQNVLESLKWNKEQWELRDMSITNVIGEIRMDFSLAVIEEKETTVVLQGVVGDVDIIIPEDIGVAINASVLIGQIDIGREKEAGLGNKLVWRSPDYDECEYKVNLEISYAFGDVKIRRL